MFVEWMMMLPLGWVTDVGLSKTAALKMLGNGVVPPQAEHAIRALSDRAGIDRFISARSRPIGAAGTSESTVGPT